MIVHLVLEGQLEEPVAKKIVTFCGHKTGTVFNLFGCGAVKDKAYKYHSITKQNEAVLVLTDFVDAKSPCLTAARECYLTKYVRSPSNLFILQFSVPEIESWLMADRLNLSKFLKVSLTKIPQHPEAVADPKKTIVNLARNSRSKHIIDMIVPNRDHKGVVAPLYLPTMQDFTNNYWEIINASASSKSLSRCISKLKSL